MHIAQPHKQPQQQPQRRPSLPLSVGVAAALGDARPAVCDRPPSSESFWVASIKSPSPPCPLPSQEPALLPPCTNCSGNRRACLWRAAIPELAPPRLPPAPSQQPADRRTLLSPDDDSKFEPALQEKKIQCQLRCLAQGPCPSRDMTSAHTGAACGIPLVSQIRGERLSWGGSAKGPTAIASGAPGRWHRVGRQAGETWCHNRQSGDTWAAG